jgi:hypothetical protein
LELYWHLLELNLNCNGIVLELYWNWCFGCMYCIGIGPKMPCMLLLPTHRKAVKNYSVRPKHGCVRRTSLVDTPFSFVYWCAQYWQFRQTKSYSNTVMQVLINWPGFYTSFNKFVLTSIVLTFSFYVNRPTKNKIKKGGYLVIISEIVNLSLKF